jgi:hypothetical protein
MDQIAQIAGAVLILIAFTANQRGSMAPHSLVYLVLNFVGSLVLAAVALTGENWGFLMLEGVWAVVSAWGLLGALRGQPPAAAH